MPALHVLRTIADEFADVAAHAHRTVHLRDGRVENDVRHAA